MCLVPDCILAIDLPANAVIVTAGFGRLDVVPSPSAPNVPLPHAYSFPSLANTSRTQQL
jgi:hypothetical protein